MVTIGIPRALLYHQYGCLWETFYNYLGAHVLLSPVTNKEILDKGVELMVDEACLPLKLFAGHAAYLQDKVDYLFIPRVVSVEQSGYSCPKIIGLPDITRQLFPHVNLIVIDVDVTHHPSKKWFNLFQAAGPVTANCFRIMRAYQQAVTRYRQVRNQSCQSPPGLASGKRPLTVAVVGHPYHLYDEYTGAMAIQLVQKRGVRVITPEFLERREWEAGANHLSKPLFWTFCRKIVGSAFCFLRSGQVDGVINIMSFGCGPDAFSSELLRLPGDSDTCAPLLQLSLDEHSGDAGMITRIEAFLDMIVWRKNHESHVSTSRDTAYCHSRTIPSTGG